MSTKQLYHIGLAEYDPRECTSTYIIKYKVSRFTTVLVDSTILIPFDIHLGMIPFPNVNFQQMTLPLYQLPLSLSIKLNTTLYFDQ
jgi:hypothetical protein